MVKTKPLPPVSYLQECFDCDFETGVLRWKRRPSSHFQDGVQRSHLEICKIWNTKFCGKQAGCVRPNAYRTVVIDHDHYQVHRIIYAMYKKADLDDFVDHINGNRLDNSIRNLREVTHSQNAKNTKIHKNNKTGVLGVYFFQNRWCANIKHNKKLVHLGRFRKKSEAISARKAAEIKYGYHPNHGRAA